MKKLLLVAVTALTLFSAQAEKVKLGSVVVADRAAITRAVNKLGELSCNVMLSGMLAGQLAAIPSKAVTYSLSIDGQEPDLSVVTNAVSKLGPNVLVRLSVCGDGVRDLIKDEKISAKLDDEQKALINSLASAEILVKVDDNGVSLVGTVKAIEGSKLAAMYNGATPLAADALAFAGKDAVIAGISAPGCDTDYSKIIPLIEVLKKHGIEVASFIELKQENGDCFIKIDVPALVTYMKTHGDDDINTDALKNDITALKRLPRSTNTSASRCSIMIKGYESPYTPTERLAATLPNAATKTIIGESVWSYYATAKAVLPQIEEAKMFAVNLPAELKGGCAMAVWRENATEVGFIVRISADEIKSWGLASNVIMAAMMSGVGDSACADDDDEADDEDDDED